MPIYVALGFNLNLRRTSPLEHNNSMEGTPLDQEAK